MNEGWKCPVCSRGVSPGEKTCDHGGMTQVAPDWEELVKRMGSHPATPGTPFEAPHTGTPPWYPPYKVTSVSGTVSAPRNPNIFVWN